MNRIPCPIQANAARYPNRPALISDRCVLSYAGYEDLVQRASLFFSQNEIVQGDRVALLLDDNRWEYPVWIFALLRLGAIPCLLNPGEPILRLQKAIESVSCNAFVTTSKMELPFCGRSIRQVPVRFDWAHAQIADQMAGTETLDLDADATILFTSGTSARPKAVLHTYGNHYFSALGANEHLSISCEDRWLLNLPLHHVSGLGILFRMALAGAAVVMPGPKEPLSEAIERLGITRLSLVSTQLIQLLAEGFKSNGASQLRTVLAGGGPVPQALIDRALEAGIPIRMTYGLTEMASQVTAARGGEGADRAGSSGTRLAWRDLRVDADGEILVRGKTLFKGYVQPDQIHLPLIFDDLNSDGWFQTGDLGHIDNDGYLFILGRRDNMFVSGGENIHPEQIEEALCRLEDIVERAIVVPVPDEKFGYRPVAFLRCQPGAAVEPGKLVWLGQHISRQLECELPKFMIPISFYPWPEESEDSERRIKPDRLGLARLACWLRNQGREHPQFLA